MTELTVGSQLARLLGHLFVPSAFRAPPRLTAPPSMHIRSCTRLLVNRDFDYDYDYATIVCSYTIYGQITFFY